MKNSSSRKEFKSIEKYKKRETPTNEGTKSKISAYKNPYLALGSKNKKKATMKRKEIDFTVTEDSQNDTII